MIGVRRQAVPYLLVLPAVILLLLFVYGMVNGILQGFGIMPYLGLTNPTFAYYAEALTRPDLIDSIRFSLYLAIVSSVMAVIGGVALSLALTHARASRSVRLLGINVPLLTSHTVAVLFVIAVLGGSGMLARVAYSLGLVATQTDVPTIIGSTGGWGAIAVYLWKEIPFIAFSTVTIMANISDRFAEAAASLGASPVRTFFSVTLPLCAPAIAKAFLIVFAFAFGAYEVPYLLGPTLPRALPVLAYLEYTSPILLDRASAMALNGIMSFITLALAIVYFRILRRERAL